MKSIKKISIWIAIILCLGYIANKYLDEYFIRKNVQETINIPQLQVGKLISFERSEPSFGGDVTTFTEVNYTVLSKDLNQLDSILLRNEYQVISDSSFGYMLNGQHFSRRIKNAYVKKTEKKGDNTLIIIDIEKKVATVSYTQM